ncbi:hypothetical protein KIW84_071899 [Lathyrus oleraceus]|uniref:Uncharacterized protein n=1 Tax=Pisum sativum TaxID=3888 RepID=A0A9D4VJZ1_PEA|nr:hypothetical protein KIW84_071899 [Pisum sativum]
MLLLRTRTQSQHHARICRKRKPPPQKYFNRRCPMVVIEQEKTDDRNVNLSNANVDNDASDSFETASEADLDSDGDEDTGTQVAPIVKLEEVVVTTGEENEDAILDLIFTISHNLSQFHSSNLVLDCENGRMKKDNERERGRKFRCRNMSGGI